MGPGINLTSARAAQARLSLALNSAAWRAVLWLFALCLLAAGGWLWYMQSGAYAVLAGLAAWPVMLLAYYHWWLADLPPVKKAATIDDVLEAAVLARLKHT